MQKNIETKNGDEQMSPGIQSLYNHSDNTTTFEMHNNSSTSKRQQKDTSRVVLEKDSVAILDIDHSPDLYKEDVDESKSIEANTTLSTEPSSLSISTRVFIFIGLQIALLLTAMDR